MGRGVIPRTMQEGGMVDPMMMQEPAPQGGEVDPDVLAGMFGEIEGQIQGLDQAEDIEGMMNAVRGDQQPVEARRAELAELVGPEDAQETPDSVLALVQPIMQLASVDQGIGGLAADSMGDVAMEGPMAEGIMSTVNTAPPTDQAMMAPPMDPAMMGVGNQPPVNFRYGVPYNRCRPVALFRLFKQHLTKEKTCIVALLATIPLKIRRCLTSDATLLSLRCCLI